MTDIMVTSDTTQASSIGLKWVNILFLVTTPFLALAGVVVYARAGSFHWSDAAIFFLMYVCTGMAVTAGYHPHYSHRSYDASLPLQLFYLLFGAAAFQNSLLRWGRDHRIHHMKVDREEDPYNIRKGFWHAHILWIFQYSAHDEDFRTAPDLLKDPWVRRQDRWYLPIAVLVGFALPAALGWLFGRPAAGFLWGGLVRVVVVHHMTFFINSLAHMVGKQPYSLDYSARDSWWLAFFTYGEGYHNFHHRFAADYRNGLRWYQWDPTKWWIQVMNLAGLADRLTRFREEHILRARIETDMRRVQQHLSKAPARLAFRLEKRLEAARLQLEAAAAKWEEAKAGVRTMRKAYRDDPGRLRRRWDLKLREYDFQFQAAQARWAFLIAAFSRLHA